MFVLAVMLCACGNYSKNVLASNVRTACDSSITVLLDQVPEESYAATKATVISLCGDLKKFMSDGKISDLPLDELKNRLIEFLIKKGYDTELVIKVIDWVFGWLQNQEVPVQKLDAYTVLCIVQGIESMERAAILSKLEWRPVKE